MNQKFLSPLPLPPPAITQKWYWKWGRVDILLLLTVTGLLFMLCKLPKMDPEFELEPVGVTIISVAVFFRLVLAFALPTLFRLSASAAPVGPFLRG